MALAGEAEDALSPGWADRAYQVIERIACRQAQVHVDDVLAEFAEEPNHPNAWGQVWMRAIRAGIIRHSGHFRSTADRRKHRHNYPIYESLIC